MFINQSDIILNQTETTTLAGAAVASVATKMMMLPTTVTPMTSITDPDGTPNDLTWLDQLALALSPQVLVALRVVGIAFFLLLSGLISGLHLALMSLDIVELRCMEIAGNERERSHARKILPVRARTNFLLTSLILAVVACDSATTLLIGSLTSDAWALFLSTVLITIFAGILPEAVVFKYSSIVAAKTIYLTYLILILTCALSYPSSLCLDCCIKHRGPVRNRKYLAAYIDMIKRDTHLEPFEVATLQGTLSLSSRCVRHIMTPIDRVVSLSDSEQLDWQSFVHLLKTGYSRIPIYRGQRSAVVGLLHVKEIATVFSFDSAIKVPVKFLMDKAPRTLSFVSADSPLSRNSFINSLKTGMHMAFVVEGAITNGVSCTRSQANAVIGIVTLEDMIQAVIGQEISDEMESGQQMQQQLQQQQQPPTSATANDHDPKQRRQKGMLYAQQILKALQEGSFASRPHIYPL